MGYIYCLTSPSGKKYIGQCTNFKRRMRRYECKDCKKQPKIYKALCKYGFYSFKVEIIEVVDISLLNEKETFYILKYDTMNNGYNCTTGGDAHIFSEETKKKMSKSHSGSKNGFFGKSHTPEVIRILSENAKEQMKNGNPFQGKKHSTESIEKMRKYRLGKKLSNETKDKLNKIRPTKDKCHFAKKYKIISPLGEIFMINGTLKEFIKNQNLSLSCVKKHLDSGKIPQPINLKHNRMSNERINSTNWEFLRIE